ncbi:MAG: BamA/TamA family outer membrane protein, partial [Symploca sp. SIO2B6]|nr:BamA/TamA family outer membrane protein [Symploca sp. SIO2B6]
MVISPYTALKLFLAFTLPNVGMFGFSAIAHANGWPTTLPNDNPDRVFLYPDIEGSGPDQGWNDSVLADADNIPLYPDVEDSGFTDSPSNSLTNIPLYPEIGRSEFDSSAPVIPTGIPIYPETDADADAAAIPIYPAVESPSASPTSQSFPDAQSSPSPTIRSLQLIGANALTPEIATALFRFQMNRPVSDRLLEQGSFAIDQWYLDNGYSLSRVVGLMVDPSGILIVEVAEPQVRQIAIRYVDDTGSPVNEDGQPIVGRTSEAFVLRELQLQPGDLFNQNEVIQDIRHLVGLGLFHNANVAVEVDEETPADPAVDVVYALEERLSRSFQASGGVSTELGLFAGVNYRDSNVRGQGDSIRLGTQVGSRGLVFSTGFTHPYRDSQPNRLGYDINAFRSTGQSLTFSDEVGVANGDDARERQFGGGVAVMRPLGNWDAELGLNYTRTSIRDESGDLAPQDEFGNDLTISDSGIDDLVTVGF